MNVKHYVTVSIKIANRSSDTVAKVAIKLFKSFKRIVLAITYSAKLEYNQKMYIIYIFIQLTIALINCNFISTTNIDTAINNNTEYIKRINTNYDKILACKDCCYPINNEFCQLFYNACGTLSLNNRLFLFSNKNITANDIGDSYCNQFRYLCSSTPKADLVFLTLKPIIIINYKKIYLYESDYNQLLNEMITQAEFLTNDRIFDIPDENKNLQNIQRENLAKFKYLFNNKTSNYKTLFSFHMLHRSMIEVDYKNITEVFNEYYNLFVKNKPKKLLIFNKYKKEYCQDLLVIKSVTPNISKELCTTLYNFTKNTTDVVISVTNLPPLVTINDINQTNYSFSTSTNKHMQKKNNNSMTNFIIPVSIAAAVIASIIITVGIKYFIQNKHNKKTYRVNVIDSEAIL